MNPLILVKRHSCRFSLYWASVLGVRLNCVVLPKRGYYKSGSYCRTWRRVATPVAVISMMFLASCWRIDPLYKIPDICTPFEAIPLTNLTAPDPNDPTWPKVGFENVGQIKVMHGFGNAKLDSGKRMIRVEQSVAVPDYANKATVFLNGWRLGYLGGDHHVEELGALIIKITLDQRNKTLTWNALGELRDQDFKEGYSFTYYYTVIAWNDVALNLIVDHSDCTAAASFPNNAFIVMNKEKSALLSFSSYSQNPAFRLGKPVAVLPRGFGFYWAGDRHLLQIAYNLDHSEIFLEGGRKGEGGKRYIRNTQGQKLGDTPIGELAPLPTQTSRADAGVVSWDTFAIIKDNGDHEEYLAAELVSTLSGNEVGLIQPPFVIRPVGQARVSGLAGSARTQEYVIENIPFEGAIPMLTGWELRGYGSAEHILDVGIWKDQWTYIPGPSGGTLRYSLGSDLADNDHFPDYIDRHRITILGIRPIVGGGVLRQGAAR
jgi:hypothetical protein